MMIAFDFPEKSEALNFDLAMRKKGIVVGRNGCMIYIKGTQVLEPFHCSHFKSAIEDYYDRPLD